MPTRQPIHLKIFKGEYGPKLTAKLHLLAEQKAKKSGEMRRPEEIVQELAEILNTFNGSKDAAEQQLYDATRDELLAVNTPHAEGHEHLHLLQALQKHALDQSHSGMTQADIFKNKNSDELYESLQNLAQQRSVEGDTRPVEVIAEELTKILNTMRTSEKPAEQTLYRETRAALFAAKSANIELFALHDTPDLDAITRDERKPLLSIAETFVSEGHQISGAQRVIANSLAGILKDPTHPYHSAITDLRNVELDKMAKEARTPTVNAVTNADHKARINDPRALRLGLGEFQ